MTDQRTSQIHTALDVDSKLRLEVLGKQLREDCLLREVLPPDHKSRLAGAAATRENESHKKEKGPRMFHTLPRAALSRRSIHPNPALASTARIAAGIAPARITLL